MAHSNKPSVLTLLSLCLLTGTASFDAMAAANYCTTKEHAQAAVPLAELFISSPQDIQTAVSKQVQQNPQLAGQEAMLIQGMTALVNNKHYQKGMINIMCKHYTPEELATLDPKDPASDADRLLQPKMSAIQGDIKALSQEVQKASQR